MKYDLAPELSKLSIRRSPSNIYVYPFVNILFGNPRFKSDDSVIVKKLKIKSFDGHKLNNFIIEPKDAKDDLPCIVFFHGGGFLLKAAKSHCEIAKEYAKTADCKVIFADYRLMPKYRFPFALKDSYHLYNHILKNADKLNIDKDKIVLAGDSAGANIAISITLKMIKEGAFLPKGEILIYPVTDRRMQYGSMKRYTDTPVWDSKVNEVFWREYLKFASPNDMRYASPMEAESFKGFPDTYIEVAEFDCLHDEGIAFAKRLESEGIPVEYNEIKGTCHGFEAEPESSIVRDAMKRRTEWMNDLFTQKIYDNEP